jgi:DNA repair exonuclease SbcCD ATPase subunit
MDIDQLAQMVQWLDEEHRRDRGEIAKLQTRIESQATEIVEQARRVQELEGQLASTQAQLVKFSQVDQALQQLKNEVVLMLERREEQRLHDQRESERTRVADREAFSRGISEVRKDLPRLNRIDEELALRKAEDQRLSEIVLVLRQQVNSVNKDIDERTRSLPFLAEQRTQDNKRVAQLQQENVELFKRTEAASGKLQVLEGNLQRLDRAITAVQPIPSQLRQEVASFVESQKLTDVERDRALARWREEFEEQRQLIAAQQKRLTEYSTQIEEARRMVAALQGFEESIRREHHQVAELQRLAEERQRKELDNFVAEDEKRWKKQTLAWDHQWSEQAKVNKSLAAQTPPLRKELDIQKGLLRQIWRLQETYGAHRLQEAQRWLNSLEASLKELPKEGREGPRNRADTVLGSPADQLAEEMPTS